MERKSLLFGVSAAAALAWAYIKVLRPWVINWGATKDEVERLMPGDDLLPNASPQTTRAITIDAAADRVWPWLVQMGPRPRAGAYTYDWIERLLGVDIQNSDRIMPEFQHLDVGDFHALNTEGKNGLRVKEVHEKRALVLQWEPAGSSWAFELSPADGGKTRLVSRNRLPGTGPSFWLMAAIMEPASLVMERKMLLGIKERTEGMTKPEERIALDRLAVLILPSRGGAASLPTLGVGCG